MNRVLLIISSLLFGFTGLAQNAAMQAPQMADRFREDGKIYVVVAVISIIFICLGIYLFSIDKKLRQLERDVENKS
ncbi:MAG TPA: CcmD family protein [Bacteroidia bacterium]|nr:CcmD family protein [Bacteroidia bacterium]